MEFRILPENLHSLGEQAARHFAREYGIQINRFKVEEQLSADVGYRPTLYAKKTDHSLIGIEVSDQALPPEIQNLVLGCKNNFIPLKLWIVAPYETETLKSSEIQFFRDNGIGLLALHADGRNRQLAGPPLPLSLTGLRPTRYVDYPARYREDLRSAQETFISGNPSKGCSLIYDELENLTRRILKKAIRSGFITRPVNFDPDREPWSNVLTFLKGAFNRTAAGCPGMTEALLNRILGLTEFRNESGHKPASFKAIVDRDRKLRTRFESAADELHSLIRASQPLRP